MNKQETAEAILVMQAYVDGDEIQLSVTNDHWHCVATPDWDFENVKYRIKPTPREFWMNTYTWEVLEGEPSGNNPNWVHVREVL